MKHRAEGGKPAVYWPREEQITRLEAAYVKWDKKGGVWTAAAKKVRTPLNFVVRFCRLMT